MFVSDASDFWFVGKVKPAFLIAKEEVFIKYIYSDILHTTIYYRLIIVVVVILKINVAKLSLILMKSSLMGEK